MTIQIYSSLKHNSVKYKKQVYSRQLAIEQTRKENDQLKFRPFDVTRGTF
jgi:hypothetical protein